MPEELADVVRELRGLLLSPDLHRAVVAGRRHGAVPPAWRRAELRPVQLKAARCLQEVRLDELTAHTRNHCYPDQAAECVDELLAAPWGNWHVRSTSGIVQVRITKSGRAQVHRTAGDPAERRAAEEHDRRKARLLAQDDPLFAELGAGADKRRQVEAFLRLLITDLPAGAAPLHVVDLGCGNAYLSFAALRYLTQHHPAPVRLTGVDRKPEAAARNTALAQRIGLTGVSFVAGDIADAPCPPGDVVLALHACDTATDDALARAVRWAAPLILAAPCCHHETAATVRGTGAPGPYGALLRQGILRERMSDVLTDGLRALLLRLCGYRVDVVEFVAGEHTARNLAIRAVCTDAPGDATTLVSYRELVAEWGLRPRLAILLADELRQRHGGQW